MYFQAVKSAFGCFPLDPPRKLVVGDYVRITWGGKVHHRGNLTDLLGMEIEVDEHVGDIEFMSASVSKAGIAASLPMTADATIKFSKGPGLYLKGKRRTIRGRNLDALFSALSKADLDWSFRNRIVIETHALEGADLYCSGDSAAEIKTKYDQLGVPVSVDASAALEHRQLLHLPNVTGTIAFSPVRLVFGVALAGNARDPKGFVVREMDADDPDDYESETAGDEL